MKTNKITTKHKKECFICFCKNKKKLLLLSHIIDKKNCKCDSFVHKDCLIKWTKFNSRCPICNSNIDNGKLTINKNPQENIIVPRNTMATYVFFYIIYVYEIIIMAGAFAFFFFFLIYILP